MVADDELVRAFEAGEVPDGGFHHEQHVRVAWFYLKHHSLPEALARFVSGLKHFAECRNRVGLYHETITVAYVLLINERLAESADATWMSSRGGMRNCSSGIRRCWRSTTGPRHSRQTARVTCSSCPIG